MMSLEEVDSRWPSITDLLRTESFESLIVGY